MRNLRRRIEVLEKYGQTVQAQREQIRKGIMERALSPLGPTDEESLLSAFGAERAGRNLTETEEAAKQAYLKAFLEACPAISQSAGKDLASTLDPGYLVIRGLSRLPHSVFRLLGSAIEATQAGRSMTEEESSASQAGNNEYRRLWGLAGGKPCPEGQE